MSIGIGNKIIAGKSRVVPHYIGEIFHAPYDNYIPEGAVPADGSEYSAMQFPTLWKDWIQEGKLLTCTYEEFDADITNKGSCKKFAIDTLTSKFKVPYVISIIEGKIAKARGNGMTLGLTNGIKNAGLQVYPGALGSSDAAFGASLPKSQSTSGQFTSGEYLGITTDPTKSGIVTELPHETCKFFVQLANGAVPNSLIDWNNYIQALTSKANTDLSNVDQNLLGISKVIETKYNEDGSWFRLYSDKWLEQGGLLAETQVNFLKPFKDVNYIALITPDHHWGGGADIVSWIGTKTTTGFNIDRDRSGQFNWYVCGQSA